MDCKLEIYLEIDNDKFNSKGFILMEEERKKLEKMYQELNEEDTEIKKSNQALIPKAILLFPLISFVLTFPKINAGKSIIDLFGYVAMGGLLVFGGIFLNYLLSKGK